MKRIFLFLSLFVPILVTAQVQPGSVNPYKIDSIYRIGGRPGLSTLDFTPAIKSRIDSAARLKDSIAVRPPTVTSLASLTASTLSRVNYDGDTWVKVSGATSTTTVGYPGYVVPAPGNYHYERVFSIMYGISVKLMGAVDDSTTSSDTGFSRAIAFARSKGTFAWVDPVVQKYLLSPIQLQTGDIIRGIRGRSRIKRNGTRGSAFYWNGNNVTVSGLSIWNVSNNFEGAVWLSGSNNLVEGIDSYNSHTTSFVIEAIPVGGGAAVTTENNIIRRCLAVNQAEYHGAGGGKAPFIVAGYKSFNNRFEYCIGRNNVGDVFDSDNARGTVFDHPTAIHYGTQSTYAGVWGEGGEDSTHITVISPTVINFAVGVGTSEYAGMTVTGSPRFDYCQRAVDSPNGNTLPIVVENARAFKCGNGLASSDNNGVYRLTGPGTLINCVSDSSYAKYDFVNYAAVPGGVANLINCRFKDAQFGYETSGNQKVIASNLTITGKINWQSTVTSTQEYYISGGNIYHLDGNRAKKAVIDGVAFKGFGSGHAVYIVDTDYSVQINNCSFDNFAYVHQNAILGFNNTWSSITNAPSEGNTSNPGVFVKGTNTQSAADRRTEATADTPSGFATINAAPGVTLYPTDPYAGLNLWYRFRNRMNHLTGEYWTYDQISNLNGSWIGARLRNGFDNTWFPTIRFLTDQAMSGLASGQFPKYNGTNWVNANLSATDIASGTLAAGRIASGTPTDGYIPKMISGVPTWSPDATGGGGGGGGVADPGADGFMVRNAADVSVARSITVTDGLSVTNPNGVSGNPVIGVTSLARSKLPVATSGASSSTAIVGADDVRLSSREGKETVLVSVQHIGTNQVLYNSNSGSGAATTGYTSGTPVGGQVLTTGTTATGVVFLGTSPSFYTLDTNTRLAYEVVFSVPTFSDGTNTFQCILGFTTSDGNSGNIVGFEVSGASPRGQVRSGGSILGTPVGAMSAVAGTKYRARVEYGWSTSAQAYTSKYYWKTESGLVPVKDWPWAADGSDVVGSYTNGSGSITFPAGPYGAGAFLKKSIGVTPRTVIVYQSIVSKMPK